MLKSRIWERVATKSTTDSCYWPTYISNVAPTPFRPLPRANLKGSFDVQHAVIHEPLLIGEFVAELLLLRCYGYEFLLA